MAPKRKEPVASSSHGSQPTTSHVPTRQTPVYPPIPRSIYGPLQPPLAQPQSPAEQQLQPSKRARPRPRSQGTQGQLPHHSSPQAGRSSDLVAPEIAYHVPQAHQPSGHFTSPLVPPHGPSAVQTPRSAAETRRPPAVVTPVPPPRLPTFLPSTVADRTPQHRQPRTDRNIDKVVLGDLCFRTWYPSYYGKELLGDLPGSGGKSAKGGGGVTDGTGHRRDKDHHQAMLERLYVCPSCFKYSRELVAWWGHVRVCERRGQVPGRKIYAHPQGKRKIMVPQGGPRPMGTPKRRRGDGGVRYVEETVEDKGEWSIWEVDGEDERLYCQNLSLFAKLFLDNKSVFFDVTGFNYYLLAYTPPHPTLPDGVRDHMAEPPRPQVVGFFSKEKMSWDNNNLACILVFPPWQRKGLGALLMGASYEISRRDGVVGGPEKPISDLGRKGYRRFWAGEVARWLLSLQPGDVVDVRDCSEATFIAVEDCLGVLRDMNLVEDAGVGPGKSVRAAPGPEEGDEDPGASPAEDSGAQVRQVPRVRVDKEAVKRYVSGQRINLERTCDAASFIGGELLDEGAVDAGAGAEE